MFRCKECGTEFEEKPNYCDCGNDSFDEIKEIQKITEVTPEIKQEVKEVKKQTVVKNILPQKTFDERYPEFAKFKASLDPISVTIFSLCILFGIIILLFVGNPSPSPKNTSVTTDTKKISNEEINIPTSTKDFWNTSTDGVISDIKKEEPIKNKIEEPVIKIFQPTPQTSKPISKTVSPKEVKTTPKISSKTTSTPKTNNLTTKSVPKTTTVKKQVGTTPITNAQTGPTLENYKTKLRNNIAGKINFAGVNGNGTSIVTFKISSTGTLINRNFALESGNDSLDGAVYNAMMATPTYSAPPSTYKNETLRLTVSMYNGNFEVSLR